MKKVLAPFLFAFSAFAFAGSSLPPVAYPVSSANGGTGSNTYVNNWLPSLFPNTRVGIANTEGYAPAANFKFCAVGDSTTAGVVTIGTNAGTYTNGRLYSYPYRLAALLNQAGIPASTDSWFGDAAAGTHSSTLATYDSRITQGTWVSDSTFIVAGGNALKNFDNTSPLSFAVSNSNDTADIYYVSRSTTGTFTWQVDGGSATAVNTAGSDALQKITIPLGAHAAHTISIIGTVGTVEIAGMSLYDSVTRRVLIYNMGYGGSQTGTWALPNHPWNPGGGAFALYGCKVSNIMLSINDWINSAGPSVTASNMASIIAYAKASGDVSIMTPIQSQSLAGYTTLVQAQYEAAILSQAAASNVPVYDLYTKFGAYSSNVTLGFMGSGDNYHPTPAGYTDLGSTVFWLFTYMLGIK
jgi:lysophospholipase L1-like esterase